MVQSQSKTRPHYCKRNVLIPYPYSLLQGWLSRTLCHFKPFFSFHNQTCCFDSDTRLLIQTTYSPQKYGISSLKIPNCTLLLPTNIILSFTCARQYEPIFMLERHSLWLKMAIVQTVLINVSCKKYQSVSEKQQTVRTGHSHFSFVLG